MPRPVERGRAGVWSLIQIATEAGTTRGVARTAVSRGFLPDSGYSETDIVMLRVAAACLAYPDPDEPLPPKHSPEARRPGRRDDLVIRFAKAILGDSRADTGAAVLFAGSQVLPCDRGTDLPGVLLRFGLDPVVVLPVGRWRRALPISGVKVAQGSVVTLPKTTKVPGDAPNGGTAATLIADETPAEKVIDVTRPLEQGSARRSAQDSDRPVVPGEPW